MHNKQLKTISIVTCSYNQREFIEATIQSVINQNNVTLEYIVIDGNSTDGSQQIIRKYEDYISYWASEPDSGQSEAINKGLRMAKGDIVGWLCSDDLLLPNALQHVIQIFNRHPEIDAVYGNAILIDSNGELIRRKREINFYPWIMCNDHNYIPQPATFWRREVHSKIGFLREDLHLTMDFEFWMRFGKNNLKVLHVDLYLAAMRCHEAQKVQSRRIALLEENKKILLDFYGKPMGIMTALLLRFAARITRILLKFAHGGYNPIQPAIIKQLLRETTARTFKEKQ